MNGTLTAAWRAHPAPRLWSAFVFAWLFALGVGGGLMVQDVRARPRLVPAVVLLAVLAIVYLWVTVREAVRPGDLTAAGPSAADVRRRLAYVAVMALLVAGLVAVAPYAEMWWLGMQVVVAAGLALPSRTSALVTGAVVTAAILASALVGGRVDPMLLMLIAFGAAAMTMRQLTVNVAQLRAAREELARVAVDQERLRFARDLHDLLGHTLSVIVLKSELAGRMLPASPSLAAVEVRDVERAARDALREVRAAVAGYRQPILERELRAARELLPAAGIDVHIDHSTPPLPQPVDALLAWAVREGVTNVIRHSDARRCEIRITRVTDWAELTVIDDGQGFNDASGRGNGLAGLTERATACGGEVRCGPRAESGYSLLVRAPLIAPSDS